MSQNMDQVAYGPDGEKISNVKKRHFAYDARDHLGLEPKTLVIVTRSMTEAGIFPSTMTIENVFIEDEQHKDEIIAAAAAFCTTVTGYPPSNVFFSENPL
jgi:hypothetical protein